MNNEEIIASRNSDVGRHELIWQAIDNNRERAIYSLKINVINKNDKPVILLPEEIVVSQDESRDIQLSDLVEDPDVKHGDSLE